MFPEDSVHDDGQGGAGQGTHMVLILSGVLASRLVLSTFREDLSPQWTLSESATIDSPKVRFISLLGSFQSNEVDSQD